MPLPAGLSQLTAPSRAWLMKAARTARDAASAMPTAVTTRSTPSVDRSRRPHVTGGRGSNE